MDDVKGLAENIGIMKGSQEMGLFRGTQQKLTEGLELSAGTIGLTSWTNAFNMALGSQALRTQRDQLTVLDEIRAT